MAFFTKFLEWIKSLFWKEEMELTLVGLQNSGKTTFDNVIAVSFFRHGCLCVCAGAREQGEAQGRCGCLWLTRGTSLSQLILLRCCILTSCDDVLRAGLPIVVGAMRSSVLVITTQPMLCLS